MPPTELQSVEADPRPSSETCSVEVAAARLGLSRGKAYELARRNALGVPVLRFGRKMAIPVRALDRLLHADSRKNDDPAGAQVA
jgi:excisionase family DNA binding protein